MRASKVTGEVRMKRYSECLLIFNSRGKKKTHAAFEAQTELYNTWYICDSGIRDDDCENEKKKKNKYSHLDSIWNTNIYQV